MTPIAKSFPPEHDCSRVLPWTLWGESATPKNVESSLFSIGAAPSVFPLVVNRFVVSVYTFRTLCVCLQRRVIRTLQQSTAERPQGGLSLWFQSTAR